MPKRKSSIRPEPINDEVMKGVMVDGVGISLAPEYIIIEGIINPPRTKKSVTVARILVPTGAISSLITILTEVQESAKKMKVKSEILRGET